MSDEIKAMAREWLDKYERAPDDDPTYSLTEDCLSVLLQAAFERGRQVRAGHVTRIIAELNDTWKELEHMELTFIAAKVSRLAKELSNMIERSLAQPAASAPPSKKIEVKMNDEQIKYMVERFLAWKLPEDFNPDGGISFKRMRNEQTAFPAKNEPVGTNLLDYTQAEAMVRYLVDGMPEPSTGSREGQPQCKCYQYEPDSDTKYADVMTGGDGKGWTVTEDCPIHRKPKAEYFISASLVERLVAKNCDWKEIARVLSDSRPTESPLAGLVAVAESYKTRIHKLTGIHQFPMEVEDWQRDYELATIKAALAAAGGTHDKP